MGLLGSRSAAEGFGKNVGRVQQVIRQAKARVLDGDVHVAGKLLRAFEPSTEVICKGKTNKPTEFGKMVKIQEAENQIIAHL